MLWTVALAAAVQAVAAGAFVGAGLTVRARRVTGAMQPAKTSFVAWWFLIGAYTAAEAIATVLSAGQGLDGAGALLFHAGQVLALTGACAGLTFYFVFLRTGTARGRAWIVAYYALLAFAFLAAAVRYGPVVYDVPDWWVHQRYAGGIPDAEYLVLWTSLRAPVIVGTAAYLALWRRALDGQQRRRIVLVGGSIIAWFAIGLVVRFSGSEPALFVVLVSLGVVSALCVMGAYMQRPDPT